MKPRLKPRERLILIVAASVALAAAYAVLRVQSKEAEMTLYREELSGLEAETQAAPPPAQATLRQLASAERERDEAQQSAAAAAGQLAAYTASLVDPAAANAVEAVMLEVTALSEATGVALKQAQTYTGKVAGISPAERGAASAAQGATPAFDPLASRPLRKLVLSGNFYQLSAFLEALSRMQQGVTVLSYRFAVAKGQAGLGATPGLDCELVIML